MSRRVMIVMTAVAMVVFHASAFAVPEVLQYQGRLTDAAGGPLKDPTDVTFSLYEESEAGARLWTQQFEGLALDNGRFNVLLGGEEAPFTPELLDAIERGADLYLGIRVDDDPEMTPRQRIASVVYGLRAAFSDSAAESGHAATADTAEFALEAEVEHAATADTAEFAQESEHAAAADEVPGMPGIAYQAVHRQTITAGSSVSVASISIETSAPGYLFITASGTLVLDNTLGQGALSHANIGEEEDGTPELTMGLVIAQVDSSDVRTAHYIPFYCQRVYRKPAGEYEFHLNVRNQSVERQVAANRPSITAIFVPNALGTAEIETASPKPLLPGTSPAESSLHPRR